MATNLIEKLLTEAVQTGGSYAKFVVTEDKIAFICDGGSRKSTRKYHQSKEEIIADERALKAISERNLLFSEQVRKIEFTLRDGRSAVYQKETDGNFCTIRARRVTEKKEKTYEYVCFVSKKAAGIKAVGSGTAGTGIAFSVKQLKNRKREITSCNGEIMNGINATGIPTDLQFILSGDFRTNGKLSIWDIQENRDVVDELSVVLECALKETMHLGLLGMPLLSVLPNSMDEVTPLSTSLMQTEKNVCISEPMFRNRRGTIVNRSKIAYGTDDVMKLFPQEIAEPFLGGRYWIKPFEAGSRVECFLKDVGVPYFDREGFLKRLFTEEYLGDCGRLLKEQNDKWLRDFYVFCSGPITESSLVKQIITGFKSIRSIRDQNGEMRYPHEVSCVTAVKPFSKKSSVIKPEFISPAGEDDEHSEQLREFFIKRLGIKEYSQKEEIEDLAYSLMHKKQAIDKVYANKLLTLARYDEAHPGEIDFGLYAIFPYDSKKGMRRVKARELVVGKPYIPEGGLLASATGRQSLWAGFKKILSDEELESMLSFAERSGAIGAPKIIMRSADKHRDYNSILFAAGKQGARDSNYDYTIPGLEEMLKKKSLKLNRLVWSAILEADHSEVLNAEYSVENRTIVNRCDSSLLLTLKERTWVPGKDGKFYMPENIAVKDISEEFCFDKSNPILAALEFGSGAKKRKMAIKEMEKIAAREGLRIISESEYQEFLEWKRNRNEI